MKIAKCLLFVSFIAIPMTISLLNENEITILADLINNLDIRFCIFLTDSREIYDIKRLSTKNKAATQLSIYQFANYINSIRKHNGKYSIARSQDFRTAIIFKEKNLDLVEEMFVSYFQDCLLCMLLHHIRVLYFLVLQGLLQKFLLQIEEPVKLSGFTWFVFLDDSKSDIFSYDFRVPFNCEFVVIQPIHNSLYKLSEIYQVKNNSFYFNFGTWGDVLNATEMSFNRRRINFNGSIITALTNEKADEEVSTVWTFLPIPNREV